MAIGSEETLPSLDKISLNNEIVHLRATAKNAKINVIRKLVKEIKTLKAEKIGLPEEIQLKKKSRAEKLIDEIHIAKTIDKYDISIAALTYDSSESLELLQNPSSTVKEKLLVKIARNKVLVSGVEKFLTKYQPITHKKLVKVVSSLGVKKKKKELRLLTNPSEAKITSVQLVATSKNNKRKHIPQDSGVSSEELDDGEDSNNATVATKKSKKAKRSENLAAETSSEIDAEVQDVGSNEVSAKKRKKAKKDKIRDARASTDEEDVKLSKVDLVKLSSKKKPKSESLILLEEEERSGIDSKKRKKKTNDLNTRDLGISSGDLKMHSDADVVEDQTAKKKKSKSKKLNALSDSTHNKTQDDNLPKKKSKHRKSDIDIEDAHDGEDAKSSPKNNEKADLVQNDAASSKVKKPAVLSTKAIRFADLLKMESEPLQSNIVSEPQVFESEKEVDGFFVSGDGKSDFMTRVPDKESAVVGETKNNKYEEIRAQYLKEYGAVPNRTELRRIEREGIKGSKSFHNVLVKEFVNDSGSSAAKPDAKRPARMFFRKPTLADLPEHPSWEAKKKAKEKLVIPFQGKKIKFD